MALLELAFSWWTPAILASAVLYFYLYPYFFTFRGLRHIPAPFPASFTNLWLLLAARSGNRYRIVDEAHKRLGPVVRIQPGHVSIADDSAIQAVLGHGNGFLKSSFYDAFVSIQVGVFTTRNRMEHTRKRKMISHTFSPKSIAQFEPYIHDDLAMFVKRWDQIAAENPGAYVETECLKWFNYLAFDMIGNLAFGAPFGMLSAGADIAEARSSPDSPPIYAPAIEILNRRGEVSATLGCLPQLKPYARYFPDPFFTKGLSAVQSLAGIAIARVKSRLEYPPNVDRLDLSDRLMEGRDERGEPLGREELTAEALTQLIAGSDTTSNSSCALLFHLVQNDGAYRKLQAELDTAIPDGVDVPSFETVRDLPYLQAVVNEAMRHHSTASIGHPREVPQDSKGIHLLGHYFAPGTVLSVPTWTIHHSTEIWGPDANEFVPERWASLTARQKNAYIPFSFGPRACVGRNVAEMQLKLIAATWVRRYEVVLRQDHMETREGFLRKPVQVNIALKRRTRAVDGGLGPLGMGNEADDVDLKVPSVEHLE